MTYQLTIHLPDSDYIFVSDDSEKLDVLSIFCKKEFNAFHASNDVSELTIEGFWSDKMNYNFNSKICELGLVNS